MDISNEIKALEERIKELKELRDVAAKLCDAVCDIEEEVSHIDESIPNPKRLTDIKDPAQRKQIKKAEGLLEQAYALIDEILGPPEKPEKKETARDSIEEILRQFPISGKGNLS